MLNQLKQHHESKSLERSEADRQADEATVKRVREYLADMVLDGVHPDNAYVSPHIDRINNKEPYKRMPINSEVDLSEHSWFSGDFPTPIDVHDLMISSKSNQDWSENRKIVFELFGGEPDFWKIIVTSKDLYQVVSKSWNKNQE